MQNKKNSRPDVNVYVQCKFQLCKLLFLTLSINFSNLLSQENFPSDVNNVLAPEVTHFTGVFEPGVDNKGDLNFSLPLLTVPGRNGLNFNITASYKSSIKVLQQASWIGLGWNMDFGSITRRSLGGLYYPATGSSEPNSDWANTFNNGEITCQPDRYSVNLPGESTELISVTGATPNFPFEPFKSEISDGIPCSNGTQTTRFVPAPWKPWKICYDLSLENEGVTQDTGFDELTTMEHSNYVFGANGIMQNIGTQKQDISKFTITTEDGTRYIFGLPTLSQAQYPTHASTVGSKYDVYVSTWRLTAILAANYSGGDSPDETSNGGWIKFNYRTWDDKICSEYENQYDSKEVDTIKDCSDSNNGPRNVVAQTTYPYRIETPTHYAEFETFRRFDPGLAPPGFCGGVELPSEHSGEKRFYARGLRKITLYKKNGANPGTEDELLREVSFTYIDNGCDKVEKYGKHNTEAEGFELLTRLGLQSITFSGRENNIEESIPAYKFEYYDTDEHGNFENGVTWADMHPEVLSTTPKHWSDDFGYFWHDPLAWIARETQDGFEHPNDGKMWSLKKIVFPEGGWMEISYENDKLNPSCRAVPYDLYKYDDFYNSRYWQGNYTHNKANFARLQQGGARVTAITKYDGKSVENEKIVYKYTSALGYSDGYTQSVPEDWHSRYVDYAGTIGNGSYLNGGFFLNTGERGQAEVTYKCVKKIYSDGSAVETLYKVLDDSDYSTPLSEKQLRYYVGFGVNGTNTTTIFKSNSLVGWGDLEEVRYYNSEGEEIKILKYNWQYQNSLGIAVVFPGLQYTSGGTTPEMKLFFTHKQLNSINTTIYDEGGDVEYTTNYEYKDGTLRNLTNENGQKTLVKYAHELSDEPFPSMKNKNMRNQIVQTKVTDANNGYSSTITTWDDFSNNDRQYPHKSYQWVKATPGTIPDFTGDAFNFTDWIITTDINEYDDEGNLLSYTDARGTVHSTIWNANKTHSIAQCENATVNEFNHTSFEADNGGWILTDAEIVDDFYNPHSGYKVVQITAGSPSIVNLKKIIHQGDIDQEQKGYTASAWVNTSAEYQVTLTIKSGTSIESYTNELNTIGWERFMVSLSEGQVNANEDVTIEITANSGNPTAPLVVIDDLRYYPSDAMLTATVYDDKDYITAMINENNIPTFFTYDRLGRLKETLNAEKHRLTYLDYFYSRDGINNDDVYSTEQPNYVRTLQFPNEKFWDNFNINFPLGATIPDWEIVNSTGYIHPWLDNILKRQIMYIHPAEGNTSATAERVNLGEIDGPHFSVFLRSETDEPDFELQVFVETSDPNVSEIHYHSTDPAQGETAVAYHSNPEDNIIHIHLGARYKDTSWHFVDRDLEADLRRLHPDIDFKFVTKFRFIGHLYVDDVRLFEHPMSSTVFYDGLGRDFQTQINIGKKDIVQRRKYNTLGKVGKEFLPYFVENPTHDPYSNVFSELGMSATVTDPTPENIPPVFSLYFTGEVETGHKYRAQEKITMQPGTIVSPPTGNSKTIIQVDDLDLYEEFVYDKSSLHRLTSQIHPDGKIIHHDYLVDENNTFATDDQRVEKVTDENGNYTKTYFDAYENPIGTIQNKDSGELKWEQSFDILGNVIKVMPPNNSNQELNSVWNIDMTYDTRGLLRSRETPEDMVIGGGSSGKTQYIYDNAGNLTYSQDAEQSADGGHFTVYHYDKLNRVIRISEENNFNWSATNEPDPAQSEDYGVDTGETRVRHFYDKNYFPLSFGDNYCQGLLTKTEVLRPGSNSADEMIQYRYDHYGNLVEKRQYIDYSTATDEWRKSIKFEYDNLGREIQIIYPNGLTVVKRYDRGGRLEKVFSISP